MAAHLTVDRRTFLWTALAGLVRPDLAVAETAVTHPAVSEVACPLEVIRPVARDGNRGLAVLRKPPGKGPFPVAIWVHGGITTVPLTVLQASSRDGATYTRLLAAGYVVVAPTYRSRDEDLQSPISLWDVWATLDHVRKLPYADKDSIVVGGCSGGADLVLELACHTSMAAVVAEEPASMVMAGMFNSTTPKKGARYTPEDSFYLMDNPKQHYTPQYQKILRGKVASITAPILIVQGSVDRKENPINRFNAEVLLPELRDANKTLEVRSYADQGHCFCIGSGVPRPSGRPTQASAPRAALDAFRDIDAFCRKHLSTQPQEIDPRLVTPVPVPTAWPPAIQKG
jgi:acetyl esterase/lipase